MFNSRHRVLLSAKENAKKIIFGVMLYAKMGILQAVAKSPRREVVRSSAGAGVVYPPFLGSFA